MEAVICAGRYSQPMLGAFDFVAAPHRRFFANARPEWDLRYFSNSSALNLSGKAQYQTNCQGLNLAVCADLPALCSGSRRFRSAVAPMYSCSGKLMLRMM